MAQAFVQSSAVKPGPADVDGPKLNLGCGFDIREGWVNIDLHDWHRPDIVCDVTRLTSFEDSSVGYALAQDILEHIHRERCQSALQEWNRILRMGGFLELRVPDIPGVVKLMHRPERRTPDEHARLLQCIFGTQSYEGDFHLNGFTEISLRNDLEESGFEIAYLGHQDEWLFDVVARKIRHCPPDPLLVQATDEQFIDAAYQKFLHRAADPEGRQHFLDKLSSGVPREVVVATLKQGEQHT